MIVRIVVNRAGWARILVSNDATFTEQAFKTGTAARRLDAAFCCELQQVRPGNPASLATDIHLMLAAGSDVKREIVSRRQAPASVATETKRKVLAVIVTIVEQSTLNTARSKAFTTLLSMCGNALVARRRLEVVN